MAAKGSTKIITGGVAFKWEGVPQMKKLLNEFALKLGPEQGGEIRERIKTILMKPANMIVDEAKALAPLGPTGRLRNAIKAKKEPEDKPGVVVYVATRSKDGGVFYARFVERGTKKMSAKPFFRPAIIAIRPMVANIIAADMKPLIEEMATKLAYHPAG